MSSSLRISIAGFERRPSSKIPRKAYVISVEGNDAEVKYFNGIAEHRTALGVDALIDVRILRRRDTKSAPKWVRELIDEYLKIQGKTIYECIGFIDNKLLDGITKEEMDLWENEDSSLPDERKSFIDNRTRLWKIDLEYLKYLKNNSHEDDVLCIVIDRDCQNNSESAIDECIQWGIAKNRFCCITNPCFEFWLLLHLCDVRNDPNIDLNEVAANRKVSNANTYVSKKLSDITHQNKTVKEFQNIYLPNIATAIERARHDFCIELNGLKHNIGSNIGELIDAMRKDKMQGEPNGK